MKVWFVFLFILSFNSLAFQNFSIPGNVTAGVFEGSLSTKTRLNYTNSYVQLASDTMGSTLPSTFRIQDFQCDVSRTDGDRKTLHLDAGRVQILGDNSEASLSCSLKLINDSSDNYSYSGRIACIYDARAESGGVSAVACFYISVRLPPSATCNLNISPQQVNLPDIPTTAFNDNQGPYEKELQIIPSCAGTSFYKLVFKPQEVVDGLISAKSNEINLSLKDNNTTLDFTSGSATIESVDINNGEKTITISAMKGSKPLTPGEFSTTMTIVIEPE